LGEKLQERILGGGKRKGVFQKFLGGSQRRNGAEGVKADC